MKPYRLAYTLIQHPGSESRHPRNSTPSTVLGESLQLGGIGLKMSFQTCPDIPSEDRYNLKRLRVTDADVWLFRYKTTENYKSYAFRNRLRTIAGIVNFGFMAAFYSKCYGYTFWPFHCYTFVLEISSHM